MGETDLGLVELLLEDNSGVKIAQDSDMGRLGTDVKEALQTILDDTENLKEDYRHEQVVKKAMLFHIKKIEKTLKSQRIEFKEWDEDLIK